MRIHVCDEFGDPSLGRPDFPHQYHLPILAPASRDHVIFRDPSVFRDHLIFRDQQQILAARATKMRC